jgi:glutamate carboxypeptidase
MRAQRSESDEKLCRRLLRHLRTARPGMVRLLGDLVCAESPSDAKPALDRLARRLAREWRRRGARVALLGETRAGDHVRAELGPRRSARGRILVLGHYDTVYPAGALARVPFRTARGRAWGPGIFDMKAGLTIALGAAEALHRLEVPLGKQIVFLFTSDEETGSATSRRLIEREARRSDCVLVLEPAAGARGRLKTARKGVGEIELRVTGRAAHAGLDPEKGVNAVHELVLQLARIMKLNDPRRGISVGVGIAAGGTRANVVPDEARALLDVRVSTNRDARRIERRLRALRPALPGARLEVRGGVSRPPMPRTAAGAALFEHARRLGRSLGIALEETAVGGGSDGNFTAAQGVPTLDGLGGVGDGAHSRRENVLLRSLVERAALLAALLATL